MEWSFKNENTILFLRSVFIELEWRVILSMKVTFIMHYESESWVTQHIMTTITLANYEGT